MSETANCIRYTQNALKEWGEANSIPVGFKLIRDPLSTDDEKVIFRVSAGRRKHAPRGQRRHLFMFEFHCLSKRGDLRLDGYADRANILASMIEEEFINKDLTVFDAVGGTQAKVGVLQFHSATLRIGDQRATIFGDSVDYSAETPKTEHWVVTVMASLTT